MKIDSVTIEQAIAHFEDERETLAKCVLSEKIDSPSQLSLIKAMQATTLAIKALKGYKK